MRVMNSFESSALEKGFRYLAGIDEAGRGPLAGPVVAAALILPPGYRNPEINDSKRLSAEKRETLYTILKQDALAIGLGVVEPSVIDDINILQATLLAMREAALDLSIPADYLLVDGRNRVPLPTPQETIVGGDGRSISIAAASIIAKVSRDKIMEIYHRQFPQYNFLSNKGYGTREHREAIRKYGYCKIHRRSFQIRDRAEIQQTHELFVLDKTVRSRRRP
ncbi:MAG: ribonuclease HII [Deltaproteobacteria bacterium]|nr:ribonuclease HII [Deltaproteobacteria bacterium]